MKKLILYSLLALSAAFCSVWGIDRIINMEVEFFYKLTKVTAEWESQLRKGKFPCYIFAGGSEVRTTIDPAAMFRLHSINAVNAGNHAGFGPVCNAATAMVYIRPGDTFVMSGLESERVDDVPALGAKFAWRCLGWGMFKDGILPVNIRTIVKALVGDSVMICFYAYKKRRNQILNKHWYEHRDVATIHTNGLLEINLDKSKQLVRDNIKGRQNVLDEFVSLCKRIQWCCSQREADFVVMIPLRYEMESARLRNAALALELTRAGIHVLKDHRLGVGVDSSYFSDTTLHLSRKGIDESAQVIGSALKNKNYWREEELMNILNDEAPR